MPIPPGLAFSCPESEPKPAETVQLLIKQDISPARTGAITVLLVEDDELQRMILVDTLEGQGFIELQAANAIEAIHQLETHSEVRLVFTDIQLKSEIDGLDLLRIVNMRWPHVSLLTTSGRIRPHYAELPIDARFIQKPVQEREMLKEMDELLAGIQPIRRFGDA
jgi:CheY-like chemotaxis protein